MRARTAGHVEQEVDGLLDGRRGRLVGEVHVAGATRGHVAVLDGHRLARQRVGAVRLEALVTRSRAAELHAVAEERAEYGDVAERADEYSERPLDRHAVEPAERRRMLLRAEGRRVRARAGDELAVLDAVRALLVQTHSSALPSAARVAGRVGAVGVAVQL